MSSSAASASRECRKSAVTEAGCASSAILRPRSAARSRGASMKRSIPNFIEDESERFRMVEIRLARGMAQRPVRKSAAGVFYHHRQSDRDFRLHPGKKTMQGDHGFELEPVRGVAHADLRIQFLIGERPAFTIALERVSGPLARG